ncbi:MAG: SWFGD domain-containing protein, partial [Sphingomicrobium sp.]
MAYDRPDHPRDERFRDDRERGGRAPQGSSDNRGFFERAGDEISRWFGDEDAERRHEQDDRSGDFSRRDPGRGERGTFFGGERDGFGGRADRNQDRAARAAR